MNFSSPLRAAPRRANRASNVPLMIEAYRRLAEVTDHPLHLGVTEAGPPPAGLIKSSAGMGALLTEGIAVASQAQAALEERNLPIQVAVMGCVVNGPGEARSADLGIAAGRHRGHLFIKGRIVRVVPEGDMVAALVEEAERLVAEGVEARLAAADEGAEAEADRAALLDARGADANDIESRVALVRKAAAQQPEPSPLVDRPMALP